MPEERWIFGARWIPNIDVERAELRTTLVYQFLPNLSAGVEYNPLADDVGPLANWRVIDETETWPALIVGTSSDRIGTEEGRSVYGTLSKGLEHETGLPIAPYAGAAWGESDDEWVAIGGLTIVWSERIASQHMWDGYNLHHLVEYSFGQHALGLMLVQQDDDYYLGLTWNVAFSMPWEGGE